MDKINYIQYKNVIPDTHVFVYKDKKFPFKFDYFKYASSFFAMNHHELEETKIINLFDSETEKNYTVSFETIENFINFVQGEKIILNNSNVIELNSLANKYDVSLLIEKTTEYIKEHQQELVLAILTEKQQKGKDLINEIDLKTYEDIISNNLLNYIDDTRLLNLSITSLYRIFNQYYQNIDKVQTAKNQDKIIEFLFKCIDKFGIKASILFDKVSFGPNRLKYVTLLIKKYSNRFDFSCISSAMIETIIDLEGKIIENDRKFNEILSVKNSELEEMVKQNKSQKEENRNLCQSFKSKEIEYLKEIESQKQAISSKNEEISKIKVQNKTIQDEIVKQKINLTDMKKEYENTISAKNVEINKIIKQSEELKELNKTLSKENSIFRDKIAKDEMIKSEKSMKDTNIQRFDYHEGNDFNGIIKYLTDKTHGNICKNGTIDVTSDSILFGYPPSNLLNTNEGDQYQSNGYSFSWICFDFKEMEVELSSYTIKSCCWSRNVWHIKSWVIEISNDKNSWQVIDEHQNCQDLNGPNLVKTYHVNNKCFTRYIRFRHTSNSWDSLTYGFNAIEFYGSLKTNAKSK